MVQVQSTWFPVIDRNPQQFVPNIFLAKESDFKRAIQTSLSFGPACVIHRVASRGQVNVRRT